MLEAVLDVCNSGARIPCCGMISQYNVQEKEGIRNLLNVSLSSIASDLGVQGYCVTCLDTFVLEKEVRLIICCGLQVIGKRITMQGFIVSDYYPTVGAQFQKEVAQVGCHIEVHVCP